LAGRHIANFNFKVAASVHLKIINNFSQSCKDEYPFSVNVKITIFANGMIHFCHKKQRQHFERLRQFSPKKWSFSSNTNVMVIFLHRLAVF
jgi:hypothetical protein